MQDLWLALEALPAVAAIRTSTVLYPLASALHILGLGILVGSILALDLRVAGLWRAAGWRTAISDLAPVASFGFALAVATGFLLFSVRASHYAANPAFLLKMLLLAAGAANVFLFHAMLTRAGDRTDPPAALRASAAASAMLWVSALVAGRWIPYSV